MSVDPLAEYLEDGPDVRYVGGPLDGATHTSTSTSSFCSYLHDDGTQATREDFTRAPHPHGYVHWCGQHIATGDPLHAYVHGSAIALWIDRADRRHIP